MSLKQDYDEINRLIKRTKEESEVFLRRISEIENEQKFIKDVFYKFGHQIFIDLYSQGTIQIEYDISKDSYYSDKNRAMIMFINTKTCEELNQILNKFAPEELEIKYMEKSDYGIYIDPAKNLSIPSAITIQVSLK